MPSLARVMALAVSIPIALVACDLFAPSVLRFGEPVRDETYSLRLPIIDLTLPSATGRPTIEYSLEPQVPGLRFDPRTRVLSGTPTTAGVYAMTYTARSPTEDVSGTLTFIIRLVEIGKSKEAATQILQGSPIRGRFADDDEVHYFRVHVPSTVHLIAATDLNPIYGSTLVAIERDGHVGSDDDYIDGLEDAQPGTYYVKVKRHPYVPGGSYEYAVAVWLVASDNATFDIEIRYVSDLKPTSADRTTIQIAVEYWQTALGENNNNKGHIVSRSGQECNGVSPVFGDYVDDLLIHFSIERIDSAGNGGPCFRRETGPYLPYIGQIKMDSEQAMHHFTVMHELAHALGFTDGTWTRLGYMQGPVIEGSSPPYPDTHFSGPTAIQAFNEAGGQRYSGAKVPLENDGVKHGTARRVNNHWRGAVFGGELMSTASWTLDDRRPVSKITLAVFEDIGYHVNYAAAQSFRLLAAGSRVELDADHGDDVLEEPSAGNDLPKDILRILMAD